MVVHNYEFIIDLMCYLCYNILYEMTYTDKKGVRLMDNKEMKSAIKDIELEGGNLTDTQVKLAQQYADGMIDRKTFVKKMLEVS